MRRKNGYTELKARPKESCELRDVGSPAREPKLYSIYLVQYVPNLLHDEFITIGLLAYEPESRFLMSRFKIDIDSIKSQHPQADEEYLQELPLDFDQQIRLPEMTPERFLGYVKTFSNLIQVAEPLFCWLNDPVTEIDKLLERHLQPVVITHQLAA
jgi:Protein of unknown function (DUF3037)